MSKWFCLLLLIVVPIAAAQADCPALVDSAFAVTNEACADLGRNQACYGNVMLNATPREGAAAFTFEQTGDVANVADIDTLQLSSMSLTDETWGVALMLLQANLPDTLPGQNVTVLLFGDVNIANAANELVELTVTATANVNVRLRPTTSANNVIASLTNGESVTANGRLADGSWVRVVLDEETQEVGWVSADFLSSEVSLDRLIAVEADNALVYAPMQAFYFASSIGDSQCDEAPDSGILIQTPQGAGTVNLRVNEVDIQLGSTVYMTAGGGVMTVNVVEGHAVLTSNGVTQTVPAGTYAEIPLDTNGLANGAPTFPQPYSIADMQALPVSVALPQSVSIARPVRGEDNIEVAIVIADGLPPSGRWIYDEVFIEGGCGANAIPDGTSGHYNVIMTFSDDRSTVLFDEVELADPITWGRIDDMTYGGSTNGSDTITIVFTSPTTFTLTFVGSSVNTPPECVVRLEGVGSFVGP